MPEDIRVDAAGVEPATLRVLGLSRSNVGKCEDNIKPKKKIVVVAVRIAARSHQGGLHTKVFDLIRTEILLSCSGIPVPMYDKFPVNCLEALPMNSFIPGKSPFSSVHAAVYQTPGFLGYTPLDRHPD